MRCIRAVRLMGTLSDCLPMIISMSLGRMVCIVFRLRYYHPCFGRILCHSSIVDGSMIFWQDRPNHCLVFRGNLDVEPLLTHKSCVSACCPPLLTFILILFKFKIICISSVYYQKNESTNIYLPRLHRPTR